MKVLKITAILAMATLISVLSGCGKTAAKSVVVRGDTVYAAEFKFGGFSGFTASAFIEATLSKGFKRVEFGNVFPVYSCMQQTEIKSGDPEKDGYITFLVTTDCQEFDIAIVSASLPKPLQTEVGITDSPYFVVNLGPKGARSISVSPCYISAYSYGDCDKSIELTEKSDPVLWGVYSKAMELADKANKVLLQDNRRTFEFSRIPKEKKS